MHLPWAATILSHYSQSVVIFDLPIQRVPHVELSIGEDSKLARFVTFCYGVRDLTVGATIPVYRRQRKEPLVDFLLKKNNYF